MISLDAYVQYVYQFAAPATTQHLRRTVWEPLGLAPSPEKATAAVKPHECLYAVAPVTTNLRCVGKDIEQHLCSLLTDSGTGDRTKAKEITEQSAPTKTRSSSPPFADASTRYFPPSTLDHIGLHFGACVKPHVELLESWPPAFPSSSSRKPQETGSSSAVAPLVIVVDAGAAEALLRGSDLYAPGLVTASRVFVPGEHAFVAFYVERLTAREAEAASDEEKKHKGEEQEPTSEIPSCASYRLGSSLSAGRPLPPAQYDLLSSETVDDAKRLTQRSSFLVCIGSGTTLMGWKDILGRRTRGIALRTDWTPQLQPSRAVLRRLLGIANAVTPSSSPHAETANTGSSDAAPPRDEPEDVFFLQNYSSMMPVALLVEHVSGEAFRQPRAGNTGTEDAAVPSPSPCTVLDACAAPGGKTSLLLSLLHARARQELGDDDDAAAVVPAPAPAPFRVVCCERSRPRQEQLLRLLRQHFAGDAKEGASGDDNYLSQVLEPHCIDTNKFLKKKLAHGGGDGGAVANTDSFDAILLDPPCTGLGLRPKLLPHPHTVTAIRQSADYQRKLFDSCVWHLRCSAASPGVLVYSTCTITVEENEENVLHFLRTYPSLRLARATTAAHHALCSLSVTTCPGGASSKGTAQTGAAASLLGKEILAVQVAKETTAAATSAGIKGSSSSAPLLALRFMPRTLTEYGDPAEDSVGFFVAVFLCGGHGN